MDYFLIVLGIVVLILLFSIRQVNQYERGVKFRLGKFVGERQPGWRIVLPIIESMIKVDVRIKAVDVPNQDAITKDNISTQINAVIYYKVRDAAKAVIEVENFYYAVSQLAQTTMRNVVGELELDQLLQSREAASAKIRLVVDTLTDPWGIQVDNVELKDIVLPEDMKRVIGKQAEAERERRAVVIKAQGEVEAATNLKNAAEILSSSNGALHLRTLNTINDVSSDQSNTIIFAIPLEILRAFEAISKINKKQE
ncbi:MAG: SPFH domain / Band 7 family protein [Parcubacteria group bacterium GW2011_GWA2_39_18]|nr:MAG: SPFH domain / Band 7 family protein [Parcubacteria group bacterium GW2011_GWA2_39_18]